MEWGEVGRLQFSSNPNLNARIISTAALTGWFYGLWRRIVRDFSS
jgi:hypothetical protein